MTENSRQSTTHTDALHDFISRNTTDAKEMLSYLHDDDGHFYVDEGLLHDYKAEYPFSNSDGYFSGVLKLICAFHNSYGGVIVFGVHDTERTAGRNKVRVDSERINRKLREVLSSELEISVSHVETPSGDVQVMRIPARESMTPPVYFKKRVSKLDAGVVYLRRGAEAIRAKGADIPFLYGARETAFSEKVEKDHSVPSSLPPSPSTIQEFVGRFSVVEKVVDWLQQSRDPRLFLWGQGGSGKSTIAYECASLLSMNGASLKNRLGNTFERVLYISGKATYLDSRSGQIKNISSRDFSNAHDLFRVILTLSDWEEASVIEEYSYDQSLDALDELFEIETQLIVIDDIDTLTTSNKDGGMEELFLTLSRAKSGTKVLYTQRGFPSFAPNAAVEVPGLSDQELSQFINLCCEKFSVDAPGEADIRWISDQSEKRPLAVETIIGMRRIAASYNDAFRRWKENSTEARVYLFNREYQQLKKDDRGRHLLAALSVFGTPQNFEVLRDVLKFSVEQLEDAIAETREMFLTIHSSEKIQGDLYSIGAATRLFVSEVSDQLDRFGEIQARVQHFKTQSQSTPPAFVTLINRAQRSLKSDNPSDAISVLTKSGLPPAFKEHPDVKAILAQAYASSNPPNVIDARDCFESALTLGHSHFSTYINWLKMEEANRTEVVNGIKICSKIVESENFDNKAKSTFRNRLARYQAVRARDIELSSPEESARLRRESVVSNIEAYVLARDSNNTRTAFYWEKVEASINMTLRRSLTQNDMEGFFSIVESAFSVNRRIDDISQTLVLRIQETLKRPNISKQRAAELLHRVLVFVSRIDEAVLGSNAKDDFVITGKEVAAELKKQARSVPA